jgi:hypothetical protein
MSTDAAEVSRARVRLATVWESTSRSTRLEWT